MSLLKANAVQLGQSITATNNFTWYQPASPDGTVRLGNGNSGSVTDLVTVGSTGNLTFTGTTETYTNSVTISAASTRTLTLNGGAGSNGLVLDASNNVGIGYNSPGAYRVYVKSTDTAVWAANTSQSQIISYNAGAANNACSTMEYQVTYGDSTAGGVKIGAVASASYSGDFVIANRNNGTFQENLRLTYTGNLGLGVTPSGTYKLEVSGTGKFTNYVSFNDQGYIRSSSGTLDFQGGTSGMRFMKYDYATQQMTLDASGNLLVGTTSVAQAKVTVSSSVGSQWGIDLGTYSTITVASGTNAIIAQSGTGSQGSGLIIITDTSATGSTAAYLIGGGTPIFLGGSGSTPFVSPTTTPAAGKACISYDGASAIRIYNNYGSTITFGLGMIKTRNSL